MAVCIDVSDEWKPGAGGIFDLRPALEKNAGLVQKGDKLLVYTGTEKLLGTQAYFDMPDFAGSTGALLEEFGITGIGMDTSTIAAMNAENQHQEILSRGMGIYESLAGLEPLIGKRFYFSAVPVKFEDGDGSPVRAYAVTE
jgi:kynurenine formamidase